MFPIKKIPVKVINLVKKFVDNNAEIYIVGGSVRDLFLKRSVKDWDFTTNLTPNQMKKLFPKNSFYNNQFGTFSIVGKNKEVFEVTTYRSEQSYSDSRHPDKVKWGKSIKQDLKRRDFTINAIALNLNFNKLGKVIDFEVIDPYNGQKDLGDKLIRTVGNPDNRFSEDALRLMRAIRICCQIGFLLEEKTFSSIQKKSKLLKKIAVERIRDEFFKVLVSDHPADGIRLLKNSKLLNIIIPELLEGIDFEQKGHHIYSVWEHNLRTLQNCQSKDPVTRLAALLHDVAKPKTAHGVGQARTFHNHEVVGSRMAVKIGQRLRLSNSQLDQLFRLTRWHMFTCETKQTDKAVRRFIRNVTPQYLDEMIALRRGDRIGSGAKESSWRWELFKKRLIEVQKQPFRVIDLKINGNDVMKILNIKPGPQIGKILNAIFKQVDQDPKLNQRKILLKKIGEYAT
ncbi:CCA tRNA nucleotidyltransferase [Patescibacteria group bacterium]|nr:CCA tRNA nucleotidyltransferase [Patescibacteria group bacterium]MCG2702414.1 CCA tRNA nucleotidyltransferase [Candidatus Parcubacteria bacterium]MBU4264536.1 CCA tRNA nucleotidyltransferase [Patescibacteria group bacterium]MBU4390467.1 CCA tRNA nucleotidyltransferase [Patescibacteria group bacterium]MBU4397383.1 CCA tRNA nucleotidyltransferase [Patescibacteria group bacterium]